MVQIAEAMTEIVEQLRAGGVRAVLDPRDVNPPCVLVRPPTVSYRFGKGNWDAEWTAWALVPSAGTNVDVAAVGQLLDDLQAALTYAVVTATPDDAVLADGSTVPMYSLSWTSRIPA